MRLGPVRLAHRCAGVIRHHHFRQPEPAPKANAAELFESIGRYRSPFSVPAIAEDPNIPTGTTVGEYAFAAPGVPS
jgi:hypothetical protein